ncbi:universal stress protein [Telluribacter sp.]|jgi:nucleotide-binding universal stress UspA family protein|uniref:universal stress protein n=1 Tax=Telluribacter sp. TaxID=1978767 RepID=UPI002E14484F|nr:universal stress protein [Telluribacter sp.]
MKNILVAVDIDTESRELVRMAAELAEKLRARVWIVHVTAAEPDFVGYGVGPQYIRDIRAEDLRDEHRYLGEYCRNLRDRGIEAEALLIQGPTVKMILAEAQKLEIDLVVIGTHDHGFLYNAFSENTALELVKKGRIPILTVPL